MNSGRIISRECPHTPGVWEYKDLHDVSSTKTVAKNRETTATMESEFQPEDDEELGQFKSFFDSIQGTDNPAVEDGWRMGPKGKGGGKGVLGKGKSTNSKSSSSKKALQPMSEEAQLKQMQKRILTQGLVSFRPDQDQVHALREEAAAQEGQDLREQAFAQDQRD